MPYHSGYDLTDLQDSDNSGVKFMFSNTPKLALSPLTTRGLAELHIVAVDTYVKAYENLKAVMNNPSRTLEQVQEVTDSLIRADNHGGYIHSAYNKRLEYTLCELPVWSKWIREIIKEI